MIPLQLAYDLKKAGLVWKAGMHDFFAIPEHDMDERIFVITDVMAYLELLQGWPVVTFHGTAEWGLDYIFSHEVVWMPTEEQLRTELVNLLKQNNTFFLQLTLLADGYSCQIQLQDQPDTFTAPTAVECYALALLQMLKKTT